MRRLFIVFLMFLLPLQSVWSAAATVCSHEKTQAGERHFGHHEVHHEVTTVADASASDEGAANTTNASDTDHHHALNVHPVSHAPSLAMPTIPAARHIPAVADPYPSALIASLERPPKATADILRQRLGAHA